MSTTSGANKDLYEGVGFGEHEKDSLIFTATSKEWKQEAGKKNSRLLRKSEASVSQDSESKPETEGVIIIVEDVWYVARIKNPPKEKHKISIQKLLKINQRLQGLWYEKKKQEKEKEGNKCNN